MLKGDFMPEQENLKDLLDSCASSLTVINEKTEFVKVALSSLENQLDTLQRPFKTTEQAAAFLQVAVPTLRMYSSKRLLPYYSIGKNNYYLTQDLIDFIINRKNRIAPVYELRYEAITNSKCKTNKKLF
jgi:hypothetical protein